MKVIMTLHVKVNPYNRQTIAAYYIDDNSSQWFDINKTCELPIGHKYTLSMVGYGISAVGGVDKIKNYKLPDNYCHLFASSKPVQYNLGNSSDLVKTAVNSGLFIKSKATLDFIPNSKNTFYWHRITIDLTTPEKACEIFAPYLDLSDCKSFNDYKLAFNQNGTTAEIAELEDGTKNECLYCLYVGDYFYSALLENRQFYNNIVIKADNTTLRFADGKTLKNNSISMPILDFVPFNVVPNNPNNCDLIVSVNDNPLQVTKIGNVYPVYSFYNENIENVSTLCVTDNVHEETPTPNPPKPEPQPEPQPPTPPKPKPQPPTKDNSLYPKTYEITEAMLKELNKFKATRLIAMEGGKEGQADFESYTPSDLFDSVTNVVKVYGDIPTDGTEELKFVLKGYYAKTEMYAKIVTQRFITIDCGILHIPNDTTIEKINIHLPFIGFEKLNNTLIGKTIKVQFTFNTLNGKGLYTLMLNDIPIQTYATINGYKMPLRQNQQQTFTDENLNIVGNREVYITLEHKPKLVTGISANRAEISELNNLLERGVLL